MERNGGGKTKILLAVVIVVVIVAVLALALMSMGGGSAPIAKPTGGLIYDDFDDASLGSFPGTSAGMMGGYPPDGGADYYGFDVVDGDSYAIRFNIDVPPAAWSGYWSFAVPGDISTDPILVRIGGGRDVSSYTELHMAVKADKKLRFKVELQDTLQHSDATKAEQVFTESGETLAVEKYGKTPSELSQILFGVAPADISSLTSAAVHNATSSHCGSVYREANTGWTKIVIPLTEFNPATTVGPEGLNLKDLRQINLVFEGPVNGTLYVDWIAFS
ncbi:MAG: hypothetical protein QXG10_03260 [Candidatus Hadarchaeales archaeon]